MNRKEFLEWLETVPEDEPIFCLRAKDNASEATIDEYVAQCLILHSPSDHIDRCESIGEEFVRWRKANKDKCKVPD